MEINLNKEARLYEQYLRINKELNRQLMQLVEQEFFSWVKDGYLVPLGHFSYNAIDNDRYALSICNRGGEIRITGAYYVHKTSQAIGYASTPIQDLDNESLSKVADAILIAKRRGKEMPVRIDEYKYPKVLEWISNFP